MGVGAWEALKGGADEMGEHRARARRAWPPCNGASLCPLTELKAPRAVTGAVGVIPGDVGSHTEVLNILSCPFYSEKVRAGGEKEAVRLHSVSGQARHGGSVPPGHGLVQPC